MRSTFEFCIPTRGSEVPSGPEWLHEIKYDGFRLRVERSGDRVRRLTRNGLDQALSLDRGICAEEPDQAIRDRWRIRGARGGRHLRFRGAASRQHDEEVQLYAFDVLAMDGDDLRQLPLSMRKTNLARLLARRPDGIFVAPFEQGEIGPDLFRAACRMGLEGMVSKHRDRPYQAGRSKHWLKLKNRKHPAMYRVMDALG
jgi:ATP-dependent DNA ligase